MVCTIAVARRGQQRNLARVLQVLRVAIARSPQARIFACALSTALCRRDNLRRKRRRLSGVHTLSRALVALVGEVITSALVWWQEGGMSMNGTEYPWGFVARAEDGGRRIAEVRPHPWCGGHVQDNACP
jgi:hypothetical protein